MHSRWCRGLLAFLLPAAAVLAADNSLGTWKLNVEKSEYTPAPFPMKSMTIIREAVKGGVKVTTTGVRTDGTAISAAYTADYDGTESAVTGTGAECDVIAVKQLSADILTADCRKRGGRYHAEERVLISHGGTTMTVVSFGTDAAGKELSSVFVYEKQ